MILDYLSLYRDELDIIMFNVIFGKTLTDNNVTMM